MVNQFRAEKVFFEIYDSVVHNFTNSEEAYNYAERVFSKMCLQSFGKAYRKYQNFETFRFIKNKKINERKMPV